MCVRETLVKGDLLPENTGLAAGRVQRQAGAAGEGTEGKA